MAWLKDFKLVVRSSITALREKVEDPERMIHQLLIDMEEELDRVKDSVADAIADEIQLGRQLAKAKQESAQWTERAKKAVARGNDDDAREALQRQVAADQRIESVASEHDQQKKETARLQRSVKDLEKKIRQARQRRTLLLARMARAKSSAAINRAIDRSNCRSAFAEFSRLEDKVERCEAKTAAYDRMAGRDPDEDELQERFLAAEQEERVDEALERLKRESDEDAES